MKLWDFFKKKETGRAVSPRNRFLKDLQKRRQGEKIEVKVFSAKKEIVEEQTAARPKIKKNVFKFKFTGLNKLNSFKDLNYFILKWKIFDKFNSFLARGFVLLIIFTLVYLSLFDRFFLVKTYSVSFAQNSFLAKPETEKIILGINENKVLGFLPANQYWFLNDLTLTNSAKNTLDKVTKVQVTERTWPNKINLEITTEPILLTLGLTEKNQEKFWRISQDGKVLTEDTSGLREKVVKVDRPIAFTQNQVTFKDYPLEANYSQINRMWFTIWLWQQVSENLGYEIISTNYPSLSDTDVILTIASGGKLLFDSDVNNIPRETQKLRLDSVLGGNLKDKLKVGEIVYIDFRIPNKRIFLCYKAKTCDK